MCKYEPQPFDVTEREWELGVLGSEFQLFKNHPHNSANYVPGTFPCIILFILLTWRLSFLVWNETIEAQRQSQEHMVDKN